MDTIQIHKEWICQWKIRKRAGLEALFQLLLSISADKGRSRPLTKYTSLSLKAFVLNGHKSAVDLNEAFEAITLLLGA